jgi:CDP-paratose 2-epimerase
MGLNINHVLLKQYKKKDRIVKQKHILITGASGLIGSEAVRFYCRKGYHVVGVDNNLRKYFFGNEADTTWNKQRLVEAFDTYDHFSIDIRDENRLKALFGEYTFDMIIHAAAQPSHDWAVKEPLTDFSINAQATLILLECFRSYCPEAVFVFTSTNKVYGDRPNQLPLMELPTRYELSEGHRYYQGVDETMSIDACKHSLFGASKVSADILVQEYGQYFNLKTGVFRGGCLTGPGHSGAQLHGFLSYLLRCCIAGKTYFIYGYKGKQVRDNIHSFDFINALDHYFQHPRCGEVYNMGGGRSSNISLLEAVSICEDITGRKMNLEYNETNRIGDHIWWVSDTGKFQSHYPTWGLSYDIKTIIEEIMLTQKIVLAA